MTTETDKTPILSVTLPMRLTNGNSGRTKHHWQSTKERRDIETLLIASGHRRTPFAFPVWLRVTRLMSSRMKPWDMDSWQRGNLKELIDSCVACGWLADDSPEYMTDVLFRQVEATEAGIVIEIFRSE